MINLTPLLWEHADYCLRVSLYVTGKLLQRESERDPWYEADMDAFFDMKDECEPFELWARKSRMYHWGPYTSPEGEKDGGSKGATRWLYDHFLKYIGVNPKKGLNGDQMRAYFIVLHLTNYKWSARETWKGFKRRLGMFPSMMEHFFFKPQALVLLFDMLKDDSRCLKLLAKVSRFFFDMSVKRNMKVYPYYNATGKISLLPTMKLLGYKMPSDDFIKMVYWVYFSKGEGGKLIRESMINGLTGENNEKF